MWTLLDFPKTSTVKTLGSRKIAVLNVLEVARVPMEKRDFDAIHRLRNTRVVIAKVCNRKDAIAIPWNKKKLREISLEWKKNSRVKKFTLINL